MLSKSVRWTSLRKETFIAFDFGKSTIGVAVGQSITRTASPLSAIKAQNGKPNWSFIEKILIEWQPNEIIVGLPLKIDGTEQPITMHARRFANKIYRRFGFIVKLHDERLTTREARVILFKKGGFRALNKKKVDSISAAIILESFLNGSVNLICNYLNT